MAPHTPVPSGSQRPPPPNRQLSALTQKSILSTATSFEADDERSFSDFSGMDEEHGPQPNGVADQPRYPGEDTRVTSRKEVSGWYSYGWAAEVFVVCGMGSFIPVTLEQLARGQGVLLSDRSTPCHTHFDPPVPPILNSTSFSVVLLARDATQDPEAGQCIINFLGREISTASFAMYTFSLSVLLQALLIISISGAADHGKYRKTFLLTFAFAGAIATMGFLPVTSKFYLVAALLAIIANICYGASSVLLNSFLPLIVRHHPSVQASKWFAYRRYSEDQIDEQEGRSLLAAETIQGSVTAANHPDAMGPGTLSIASPELQLSTKISSYGNGIGYMAAVVVQTASIAIIVATGSSTFSLRLVLFVVGLWWFLFSIPAAFWLRPRPGPPLPGSEDGSQRSWAGYIAYAWRSLGKTAMRARLLKDVLLFLGAWFLLSDGIATVSGTAVLFAKTELGMKPAAIALINVIVTLSGILGAFTWSILSRMLGLKPSHTILACICIFELIPIYGLIGYLPPLRRLGVVGLQQPWEIYPLGAVFGFVLGGISSYCRSVFGELIPPGSEATFYALYSITDKGSSVFGPAIVGAIVDATGDMRASFWFLAVLIIVPAPLMWLVDVERGKREGLELARVLEGQKNATNSQNYQTISGAVSSTTRNDPGDGIER